MTQPYHHGNLRAAVLARAAEVIAEQGPHTFSLRSLAVDLGVSHTAPRHHFGSRDGVLDALATEGFGWLADALRATRTAGGGFLELGVGYVEFALARPAHFQVMFSPGLLDEDDAALSVARDAAFAELTGGADALVAEGRADDGAAAVVAGWSLVHGLATLALSGNLERAGVRDLRGDADLTDLTRRTARLLFGPARPPADPHPPG